MGRASKNKDRPRPYRRAAYLAALGITGPFGRFCDRCGERVFEVQRPDETRLLVTTWGGRAVCRRL